MQIKETSPRRIGISKEEFIIFDRIFKGSTIVEDVYHGHVRIWDELEEEIQRVLERTGLVKNGKILK